MHIHIYLYISNVHTSIFENVLKIFEVDPLNSFKDIGVFV